MTTVAIVQSNYVPWIGYFELMRAADRFVLLDGVQFTKNDWRNRNRVRTESGPCWLTIPIRTAGRATQSIAAAEIVDPRWARRHWRTLTQSYARTSGLRRHGPMLEDLYARAASETRLSAVNRLFLGAVAAVLDIPTVLSGNERFPDHPDRNERLVAICRAAGARRYLSGPRARAYLDPARFAAAGIEVAWHDYAPSDGPRLSVLDTLLHG